MGRDCDRIVPTGVPTVLSAATSLSRREASIGSPCGSLLSVIVTPPLPIVEPPDRTLRFVVFDPDGATSATWNVVAHRNTDDVYLGPRAQMHLVKLSLHKGTWRVAYTAQSTRVAPGGDRVLSRWAPTPELGPGWRRAATVVVPRSSMFPDPEPDTRRGCAVPHGRPRLWSSV